MKINVAVLGGSGLIGQQFIRILAESNRFRLVRIYTSYRSAGKEVWEVWHLPTFGCPEEFKHVKFSNLKNIQQHLDEFEIVFSGLPTAVALDVEAQLRVAGKRIFSNAAAHRMDDDVPILIPEINKEQVALAQQQQKKYDGYIITNSNCSISGVSIFLNEIRKLVDFNDVFVSTYQALSGAGFKGLGKAEYKGNVYPYIANEEEKMRTEGKKILSSVKDGKWSTPHITLHPTCMRVPVLDGHTASVTIPITDAHDFDQEQLIYALTQISSPLDLSKTYSIAPEKHLIVTLEENRPQPLLDALRGEPHTARGMATVAGRIEYTNGVLRAVVLVHNTIRGGAGGSVLNAEYMLNNN